MSHSHGRGLHLAGRSRFSMTRKMKIRTISDELKKTYGQKVLKLSLTSGCTCPTRDGTKGWGGCSFCSQEGSGDFAAAGACIEDQIRQAKALVDAKFPKTTTVSDRKYIAYFQSFTNTYGSVTRLKALYEKVISRPEIFVLSIGTRPDCLPDEMIKMLADLNRIKPVWIELGLQTIHEKTAASFGRGYSLEIFEDAYARLKKAGLTVIVHVILGLPGESEEDMLATVRYLGNLSPRLDGIKLHLLHILAGTRMEKEYREKPFPVMTMEEYTDLVVKCLQALPEEIIIHRMTGDAPKRLLVAPMWSADKKKVLNLLQKKIRMAERTRF